MANYVENTSKGELGSVGTVLVADGSSVMVKIGAAPKSEGGVTMPKSSMLRLRGVVITTRDFGGEVERGSAPKLRWSFAAARGMVSFLLRSSRATSSRLDTRGKLSPRCRRNVEGSLSLGPGGEVVSRGGAAWVGRPLLKRGMVLGEVGGEVSKTGEGIVIGAETAAGVGVGGSEESEGARR
jgi:hypothetical protein